MDPTIRFNRLQEGRMKNRDIALAWFSTRTKRQASQNIHDHGDIDLVWASNTARIA
jgi:hypothetical protein